jgi:hypothetical protein
MNLLDRAWSIFRCSGMSRLENTGQSLLDRTQRRNSDGTPFRTQVAWIAGCTCSGTATCGLHVNIHGKNRMR